MHYGERFNALSHLVGAVLAGVGAIVLLVMAARVGDPWKIVSVSIYGVMLFLLFLTSTLYHSFKGRAKRIWCKLDHCAIYLLIAGSYTPFALVSLRGAQGWILLGTVWALAIFGIVQETCLARGKRILSLVIYFVMGWMALIAIVPLIESLTMTGFIWLVVGGATYTVGIVFYANDERWRHAHGVWHLFVMAGGLCHFIAVSHYVI